MHPIRNIKEKIGSSVEEIAVTAPQIVKDVVVAISDKVKDFNEKVLEPEEHGYTHGSTGEKILKYLTGVSKYEAGAHFINERLSIQCDQIMIRMTHYLPRQLRL
jgi:hypothetical protein